MERDVINERLEIIWNKTNKHQGIRSIDVFKEIYGYEYDRDEHIGQFNPISYFLTRMVKMGDAFKDYRLGRHKVLYVKIPGIGEIDLVDKFIHVFTYNIDKMFNLRSFQRTARLTWELKDKEASLSKYFISAAREVGWIETPVKFSFKVTNKLTKEMRNQIERILNSRISPTKDIKFPVLSHKTSLKVIKEDQYNDLLSTIENQIKKITDLERLKAELLDENQEMSSELKRRNNMTIVDPQDLLDVAHTQL